MRCLPSYFDSWDTATRTFYMCRPEIMPSCVDVIDACLSGIFCFLIIKLETCRPTVVGIQSLTVCAVHQTNPQKNEKQMKKWQQIFLFTLYGVKYTQTYYRRTPRPVTLPIRTAAYRNNINIAHIFFLYIHWQERYNSCLKKLKLLVKFECHHRQTRRHILTRNLS